MWSFFEYHETKNFKIKGLVSKFYKKSNFNDNSNRIIC